MLATRALLAALLLASTSALAADTEVCLLHSTETLSARGKPHIYETELDCGRKPTPEQTVQAALVHNAMDTVDALEIAAKAGYEVETASWRDSFTGRQILGVFTLVKPGEAAPAAVVATESADELPEAAEVPADEAEADLGEDASQPIELEE